MLKVRDLHMRDSENVTTYGGQHLQKLAAALPEEERRQNFDACTQLFESVHKHLAHRSRLQPVCCSVASV